MNTSLLLDLRHISKVGFISLFVYGQNIAELNSLPFEPMVFGDSQPLLKILELLDLNKVEPIFCKHNSRQDISSLVEKLFEVGALLVVKREVRTCSCKKVYIPVEAKLRVTGSSLVINNFASCCNSPLREISDLVIQTTPLVFLNTKSQCYPRWGNRELADMKQNLSGKQVIVSRTLPTDIVIKCNGRDFFIDNDMFVYLSPMIRSQSPLNIIAGTSLVKHATLFEFFSLYLGITSVPLIHFLPRVNYLGNRSINELCGMFGQKRVIEKLLRVAQSGKQVIAFDDSGI